MEITITVLVDNNTYIDAYYLGEPAVSYYVEADGKRILFDTGYSDVLLQNAQKLEIDLSRLDYIVLSHGHNDHTGGLRYLAQHLDLQKVKLIAHPHCFLPKKAEGMDIGAPYSEMEMGKRIDLQMVKEPVDITEHCGFLGEIERITDFEGGTIGEQLRNGSWEQDNMLDDSAMFLRTKEGIFIITGCSHSGICNIISYAKKIAGDNRIAGILGGFHLLQEEERLYKTISFLEKEKIKKLYPCHCISFLAKTKINQIQPIEEVGVGMRIVLTV